MTILYPTPPDFDFHNTITSHGWFQLPPFGYERDTHTLTRILQLSDDTLVQVTVTADDHALTITPDKALTPEQTTEVTRLVARLLSLNWDLSAFYTLVGTNPAYDWIIGRRMGRLLVGPSVWEDLAKTLLTTNTTWSQTRAMSARLCQLGTPYASSHAFPTPQHIAHMNVDDLNSAIRVGYRADYLHRLASAIVTGLDVEAWRHLPSDALYTHIRAQKGFGDYASGTMLRLLGHFDRIAIDTECRSAYKRVTGQTIASDKDIRAYYASFGAWQGLAMWMDIVR